MSFLEIFGYWAFALAALYWTSRIGFFAGSKLHAHSINKDTEYSFEQLLVDSGDAMIANAGYIRRKIVPIVLSVGILLIGTAMPDVSFFSAFGGASIVYLIVGVLVPSALGRLAKRHSTSTASAVGIDSSH